MSSGKDINSTHLIVRKSSIAPSTHMIILERKIVEYLDNEYLNGNKINRNSCIEYITNKRWPKLNYHFWFKGEKFKRKIENIFDDCIEYEYIDINCFVTKQGRDFLKPFGFFEEFLKRRKRTITSTLSAIIGALITWLFTTL